jgi:hypothetical protein
MEAERTWRHRETGRTFVGSACPAGPGWDLVDPDGNVDPDEGVTGLSTRGRVAWRAGGATPEPPGSPKPLKPYNPLRWGLEEGMEGPRGSR